MTIEEFLDKLEGVRHSAGSYTARCPAHDDREASLGVKLAEGEEGDDKILVNCYAGCTAAEIVEALQLELRDLFVRPSFRYDALPEAIYDYTDEQGKLLFQSLRLPGKHFRQRHLDPDHPDAREDGWVWSMEGVRRVPYRLPELLEAVREGKRVYIVEGEKDANRITKETGRFATCNPMGAGKWRPEFDAFFAGARVTIIQDRDEPGRRHALKVKEALAPHAAEILLFQARRGKDVSDHFDAGFKMEELLTPRAASARGIVSAAAMADAGLEYLAYRPTDLPGWAMIPGVEASIVRPGRLYAAGAYTSDGKTTFALQAMRTLCERGVRCGYFSMEMSDTDLRNRLLAHKGIPLHLLQEPWKLHADPVLEERYRLGIEEMRDMSFDVIYDAQLKPERVVKDAMEREFEFIVIDHVHRFGWGDRRQLEESIQMLTNLTLDTNIPMLILCQLRRYQRGKDMAAYPEPVLQDFRETEMLGNEASLAFALWRERDQQGLRFLGDRSKFRVLKNRHTTTRRDQAGHEEMLDFDRTTQLFTLATGGSHDVGGSLEEGSVAAGGNVVDLWGDGEPAVGDPVAA